MKKPEHPLHASSTMATYMVEFGRNTQQIGFGSAVALIGPLLFYPLSFTLWQAIDLWMRPPTRAELAGEADATL